MLKQTFTRNWAFKYELKILTTELRFTGCVEHNKVLIEFVNLITNLFELNVIVKFSCFILYQLFPVFWNLIAQKTCLVLTASFLISGIRFFVKHLPTTHRTNLHCFDHVWIVWGIFEQILFISVVLSFRNKLKLPFQYKVVLHVPKVGTIKDKILF